MPHRLYVPVTTQKPKGFLQIASIPDSLLVADQQVANGLTTDVVSELATELAWEPSVICRIVGIERTTLQRRAKKTDATSRVLNSEQSAKIYSFTKVMAAAIGLFEGDIDKAKGWLQKPARALGHNCPIDMLSTPAGVEAVLDLIGQIEHGIVI